VARRFPTQITVTFENRFAGTKDATVFACHGTCHGAQDASSGEGGFCTAEILRGW